MKLNKFFLFPGFTFMTMLASEGVNWILNLKNRDEFSSNLFLFLTHLVQLQKYYQILKYQSRLKSLLASTERMEFLPKTLIQQTKMTKYIKQSKVITSVFMMACFATCALWGVYPFTDKSVTLPLAGWFPWKTNESPFFELTYTYQIIAVTLNGLANISVDTLISGD